MVHLPCDSKRIKEASVSPWELSQFYNLQFSKDWIWTHGKQGKFTEWEGIQANDLNKYKFRRRKSEWRRSLSRFINNCSTHFSKMNNNWLQVRRIMVLTLEKMFEIVLLDPKILQQTCSRRSGGDFCRMATPWVGGAWKGFWKAIGQELR